jgi:glutamyl-Q tRNA(Asp) synthetase
MSRPVFRFAPSPNGYLHLGHALSAMLNFDMARTCGGRFLLRIEDIDMARCRPCYEQAIYEDLGWLGLDWEQPVRRQSARFAEYRAALARLKSMGFLYRSFESRREIARWADAQPVPWARDPDGSPLYHRGITWLSDAERKARADRGKPYAMRLGMCAAAEFAGWLSFRETGTGPHGEAGTIEAQPAIWGDVVLGRKGMTASYHLSVVIDDADQGVTHVVRGQDLFAATSVHRLLQKLLDLPLPRISSSSAAARRDRKKAFKIDQGNLAA